MILNKLLLFYKLISKLKYITLWFLSSCLYAQYSNNFIEDSFNKVFTNLSSIPLISYKISFTTLEANNITSTYSAEVFENWSSDAYLSLYKFNNGQLFVVYNNSLGLERFWFGKQNDLPEIKAKNIDNKILTTGISYSSFMINPLWLSIAIDAKDDQGFLVIQAYNKNKYTNYAKIEYYINKDNIPVRTLYYNSISNFPIIEVLVTKYEKINNGYFIYKMEYRDNSTKKITIIEKSDVIFNSTEPSWLEVAKQIINNNIKEYYASFLLGLRTIQDILPKDNSSNNRTDSSDNNILLNKLLCDKDTQDSLKDNKLNNELLKVPFNDIMPDNNDFVKQGSNNEDLLKALNNLSINGDNLANSKDYKAAKQKKSVTKDKNNAASFKKNDKDSLSKKNNNKSKNNNPPNVNNNKLENLKNNNTDNSSTAPESNSIDRGIKNKDDIFEESQKNNFLNIDPFTQKESKNLSPKKNKNSLVDNLF